MPRIYGAVVGEDLEPLGGCRVTLDWESVTGGCTAVAETTTSDAGSYAIKYAADPKGPRAATRRARVTLWRGKQSETRVIVAPAEDQRVDFLPAESGARTPTLDRLRRRLRPALDGESIAALDLRGVARAAIASGIHPATVRLLRECAVGAKATGLPETLYFAAGHGRPSFGADELLRQSANQRRQAVRTSVAKGWFTKAQAHELEGALDKADALARTKALELDGVHASLGLAFDLAGISDSRHALVERWQSWTGDNESFWGAVDLPNDQKSKLQYALQLGRLTHGHAPLVERLFADHQALRDLTALTPADWTALVESHGAPSHLAEAELGSEYAAAMFGELEAAHPTPMLRARSDWFEDGEAVGSFLEKHPDYRLEGESIRELLRRRPDALDDLGDARERVTATLSTLERLYRISPAGRRFETMRALADGGFSSASQIQTMGRAGFRAAIGDRLRPEHVETVFERARFVSSAATAMRVSLAGPTSTMTATSLALTFEDPTDTVTFAEMFGGRSFCSCEECQSAHGPAAYLADLLFWLGAPDGNHPRLRELLSRRPDLTEIRLSCKNARTPLPTIDLCNEHLEHALDDSGPVGRQTSLDEPGLAARPEHQHPDAYEALAARTEYPFEQPYVRWLDEVRTFLDALGITRSALMVGLSGDGPADALSSREISAEVLGITRTSWLVLTSPPNTRVAESWGWTDSVEELLKLPAFLHRAGARSDEGPLAYADVEDLTASRYVQSAGTLAIRFDNTVCDIEGARLVSADPSAHLARIAKLLRLSRDIGWSIRDLDRAIEIFGGPGMEISDPLLHSLAAVTWVARQLDVPPASLLDWWGPIDTRRWAERLADARPDDSAPAFVEPAAWRGAWRSPRLDSANAGGADADPSPFQRMVGTLDESLHLFAVTDDGSELADATRPMTDHVNALASVVAMSSEDVAQLVLELPSPELTLANVSALHQRQLLARAAGLDVRDIAQWRAWTGVDPFASPLSALELITEVRRQRSVRIDPDVLRALLGAPGERDLSPLGLPSVGAAMLALSDEVRTLAAASEPAVRGGLVRRAAALLDIDASLAEPIAALVMEGEALGDLLLSDARTVDAERLRVPRDTADLDTVTGLVHPWRWESFALLGWLVRSLDFRTEELGWLFDAPHSVRGFDVVDILTGADPAVRYAAWSGLREAVRLRSVSSDGRIFDLLGSFLEGTWDAPGLRAAIADRTGWSEEALRAGIADDVGTASGPAASGWADPRRMTHLAAWVGLSRELRIAAAALGRWAATVWEDPIPTGPTDDPIGAYRDQATELEQTLRALWGEARWHRDMPKTREGLRVRARAALVSKLVGNGPPSTTADRLGEHLLIDTQMGACATTSRIKDATRTVQSFVTRILLGQEGDLRFSDEEAEEWLWRKNYRVWEANRKVFLYPENWIQPELLTDRTEPFDRMIDRLAQGEVTDESAESAYRAYLRDLADVAKLDVLSVIEDTEAPRLTYHVFAKTRDVPATYFHRVLVHGLRWGPWTRVAKAEGEHLVPVFFQRRLILFWLNISVSGEAPHQVSVPTPGTGIPHVREYYEIHLSHSELRDGAWSPPTRSEAYIGYNDRGGMRPAGVDPLSVGAASAPPDDWDFRPESVIHAASRIEDRDVLIDLFRDGPAHDAPGDLGPAWSDITVKKIARFRFSGVDSAVSSEVVEESEFVTERPLGPTRAYTGRAQRFVGRDSLRLPLHPPSGPAWVEVQSVVRADPVTSAEIQITPVDRARFDPREPFVFADNVGTYWVELAGIVNTHAPARVGLDPELSVHDPLRLAPAVRAQLDEQLRTRIESAPALRNRPREGVHGLVSDAAMSEVLGRGLRLNSMNGHMVDHQASEYRLATEAIVVDTNGEVIDRVETGSSSDAPLEAIATIRMALPHVEEAKDHRFILRRYVGYYRFHTLYHPQVGLLREALNRLGPKGLLRPGRAETLANQEPEADPSLDDRYRLDAVRTPHPEEGLDFACDGAYAQYNWELFFHAPFLIAARLHDAGRYRDARSWLHAIFDPTRPAEPGSDESEQARAWWKFRPFREHLGDGSTAPRNVQELTALLHADGTDGDAVRVVEDLLRQLTAWRENPFDPHAIARTRPVAYMTAVVMRYLDVLLDEGDHLFAQFTMESVAEASELYFLAARLLGPRPEEIDVEGAAPRTFGELLDSFYDADGATDRIEEILPAWEVGVDAFPDEANSLATLVYFCTPANPNLLTDYWDRLADRLFKIRHCLDIEGRRRELALFEPAIDPELLVQAAASGADLQTLLNDVSAASVPRRRFLAMSELASGLAGAAQALGQALVAAIERRDTDALSRLRALHERTLHTDTIAARKQQLTEAQEQLDALEKSKEGITRRRDFYKDKPRTNAAEAAHQRAASNAKNHHIAATTAYTTGSILALIPLFDVGAAGAGGSPKVTAGFGGRELGQAANAVGQFESAMAALEDRAGQMHLTEASYIRRKEGWDLQADMAENDLEAVEHRIAAAKVRVAMAQKAITTEETRAEQLDEVRRVLENRFGNRELFDWTATQLSGLHYQSYQLAYDFAKQAQAAWKYELGREDADFIRFGYWDSRRKGLLAAERLSHDLRRMQVAYIEESERRQEIDQTFSLREIDPVALVRFQEFGETTFTIPEAFFDLFYPGHYRRRIRAVRFTLPAVVPPNTNVPAVFELDRHWVRKSVDQEPALGGFGETPVPLTSTSSAQRDGGVFDLSFGAPRLLPFEGAGAISSWRVSLPKRLRPFDYRQIHDVLVHIAYDAELDRAHRVALEGSPTLLTTALFSTVPPRRRVISLAQEHGGAFRQLAHGPTRTAVSFELDGRALPSYLRAAGVSVGDAQLVLRGTGAAPAGLSFNGTSLPPAEPWAEVTGDTPMPSYELSGALGDLLRSHTITVDDWGAIDPTDPQFDVLLVLDFLHTP